MYQLKVEILGELENLAEENLIDLYYERNLMCLKNLTKIIFFFRSLI